MKKVIEEPKEYNVKIKKTEGGTTIIDAGVEAHGGYLAGRLITEICLGGYGDVEVYLKDYGSLKLPSIQVYTDHPVVATLGSQYAGWRIKVGNYTAMASGPGRALALKPKKLYDKIGYKDSSDRAVIFLEAYKLPGEEVGEYIADQCGVRNDKLYLIVAATTSIVGSIQVSGRIVETGMHKLMELGFDVKKVVSGLGVAPIAPVHPDVDKAMGRINDMILYGGTVYFEVECGEEKELKKYVEEAPSSRSKNYGKPFLEIFEDAGRDFYNIDPALFAPALMIVNDIKTGTLNKAGRIDIEMIARSIYSG